MVARITERLDYIPPLRRVLTPVPLKLDKEYWAESQVDVPAHVRSHTVGGQGTDQDLATMIAKMMTVPMDKKRPLWDLCVIDGLEGGRLAHLLRIHHGVVDGASIPLVLDLLSDHPTVAFDPADVPGKRKEPACGQPEMLARGAVGAATRPVRFIRPRRRQRSTWSGGGRSRVSLHSRRLSRGCCRARSAPHFAARSTCGNARRDSRRCGPFTAAEQALHAVQQDHHRQSGIRVLRPSASRLKAVGKAFDVTLNDAGVGLPGFSAVTYNPAGRSQGASGGVHPVLAAHGRGGETWANHISMFFAPFPTNIEDPLGGLNTVHNDLLAARENFDALPKELFREASRFIPQAFFAVHQNLLSKAPDWISGSTWTSLSPTSADRPSRLRSPEPGSPATGPQPS